MTLFYLITLAKSLLSNKVAFHPGSWDTVPLTTTLFMSDMFLCVVVFNDSITECTQTGSLGPGLVVDTWESDQGSHPGGHMHCTQSSYFFFVLSLCPLCFASGLALKF
jgi:hypothetical protein